MKSPANESDFINYILFSDLASHHKALFGNGYLFSLFAGIMRQDHNRDPAIAGIGGIIRNHRRIFGVTPDSVYLPRFDAFLLQQFPGGIGPVGGKLPV